MTKSEAWLIFGLSPDSDENMVKKRYASLAVMFHPEKDPDGFARVHEAYEILMQKNAREMNDPFGGGTDGGEEDLWLGDGLQQEGQGGTVADGGWEDIFFRFEEEYDKEQERLRKDAEEWEKWKQDREKKLEKQVDLLTKNSFCKLLSFILGACLTCMVFFSAGVLQKINDMWLDGCSDALEMLDTLLYVGGLLLFFISPAVVVWIAGHFTWDDLSDRANCRRAAQERKRQKEAEKRAEKESKREKEADGREKRKRRRLKPRMVAGVFLVLFGLMVFRDFRSFGQKHRCGADLVWEIDSDGELLITGRGEMWDFESASAPWYDISERIRSVTLPEGVTKIGDYAFYRCDKLERVEIPSSVRTIGEWAFYDDTSLYNVRFAGDLPVFIGSMAFYGVSHIFIRFPADNPTWTEKAMSTQSWEMNTSNAVCWWIPVGADGKDQEDRIVTGEPLDWAEILRSMPRRDRG